MIISYCEMIYLISKTDAIGTIVKSEICGLLDVTKPKCKLRTYSYQEAVSKFHFNRREHKACTKNTKLKYI
jgi:hypothetical protein